MIPFALAQELKKAGFSQRTARYATYFLNEHLMIHKEDALRMRYADKAKRDWEIRLEEELVYCPTLTELIVACGSPFALSSNDDGYWLAKNVLLDHPEAAKGQSPEEAVARLWLLLHTRI